MTELHAVETLLPVQRLEVTLRGCFAGAILEKLVFLFTTVDEETLGKVLESKPVTCDCTLRDMFVMRGHTDPYKTLSQAIKSSEDNHKNGLFTTHKVVVLQLNIPSMLTIGIDLTYGTDHYAKPQPTNYFSGHSANGDVVVAHLWGPSC